MEDNNITVHYLVAVQEEDGVVDAPSCGHPDSDCNLTPSIALVTCQDCLMYCVDETGCTVASPCAVCSRSMAEARSYRG